MMILRNNHSNTHSVVRTVVVIGAILAGSSSYQTVMAADDLCQKNGVSMTCTAGTLHSNIACCMSKQTGAMFYSCCTEEFTAGNPTQTIQMLGIDVTCGLGLEGNSQLCVSKVQNGQVVGAGTGRINGVGDNCIPNAVATNGEVSMGVNPNAFEGCTNPMELLNLSKSNEDDASSVDDADVVTTAATSTNASGASSFLASVAIVPATATVVATIAGTIML